jgi:hypothetical protein
MVTVIVVGSDGPAELAHVRVKGQVPATVDDQTNLPLAANVPRLLQIVPEGVQLVALTEDQAMEAEVSA